MPISPSAEPAALKELRKAMELFDGCTGGDPKKDVITDCDEAGHASEAQPSAAGGRD